MPACPPRQTSSFILWATVFTTSTVGVEWSHHLQSRLVTFVSAMGLQPTNASKATTVLLPASCDVRFRFWPTPEPARLKCGSTGKSAILLPERLNVAQSDRVFDTMERHDLVLKRRWWEAPQCQSPHITTWFCN